VYISEILLLVINPFMHTFKPQSNRPLYTNTVIGTLAIDGWAATFAAARRSLDGPSCLLTVPNVTAHPSTANVLISYYLMWQYNYLWTLKA